MAARDTRTAFVIGATGGIGGAATSALIAHGWLIVALTRDPERARRDFTRFPSVEWVAGDAMRPADVVAAARDANLILHAANPPGYRDWAGLALPMLESAIAAARASGARLVLPGNIYNFAPEDGPLLDETTPQRPRTRKGRVRVVMEERLARAAQSGVRSLVVRAGDYFGAHAPSSWFSAAMVRPGRPVRFVLYPGRRDAGHAFAYLPDLAEAMARLAAIEEQLAPFETVHFAGHWLERGIAIAESIRRVSGRPDAPILPFPSALLYLAAPFSTTFREMIEMRYLWRVPLRLDNRKLAALIGPEPHTPLDVAVRQSLAALRCLDAEQAPPASKTAASPGA
jgi:nucleoside-diphosphate-sugar epimerase